MATNPKHINKLAPAKPAPLTEDEKAQQIARFLAQKREQFFQGILFNLVQNQTIKWETNMTLRFAVDAALDAADFALERLYPVKQEGKADGGQ